MSLRDKVYTISDWLPSLTRASSQPPAALSVLILSHWPALAHAGVRPLEHYRLMSKKRQEARKAFVTTADLLIHEVTTGKWNHIIPRWSSIPVEEWDEVLREFALRCPGHEEANYLDALRRSLWNNR